MGFLTGGVTYQRFRADELRRAGFGPDDLAKLEQFAGGRDRVAAADGVSAGWAAGRHVLDLDFALEKNVVAESLHFDLCVETERLPGDKLKAYYEVEFKALSADNPSGRPSARQKRDAKEAARTRLEEEAKDGRYTKRKCVPVMWDGTTGEVLFGSVSAALADRFTALFAQTFGPALEAVTAGRLAAASVSPAAFVPGSPDGGPTWVPDVGSGDFLGNEFLLWLWFTGEVDTDTVRLADGSEVTFMLARTLQLDCPRADGGADTFKSDGPARLPEARRAAQAGKLPRRAGLTLVRHGSQYDLTISAETLAVGSARLPKGEETGRAALDERVARVRHLGDTVDLLYRAFLAERLSPGWGNTLGRVQRWLQRDDRLAA